MAEISIVVPVYNAERYLAECVASVRRQTFEDWELILVDDGSTDGSPALCDELARDDGRIKVIHQPNGGTSEARNQGVASATGNYITFVDNDDWWRSSDSLSKVMNQLARRPVDLLWHMSCRADGQTGELSDTESTHIGPMIEALAVDDAIRYIIDQNLTTSAVWTKIVRRQLLIDHSISFPTGMRNEDTAWSAQVLRSCRSIAWHDERFYVYRMGHAYAQTSKPLPRSAVKDLANVLEENLRALPDLEDTRQLALQAFLARPMMVWAAQASALGMVDRHDPQVAFLLHRFRSVVTASRSSEATWVLRAVRLVGVSATVRLLGRAFRVRHCGTVS